MKLIQRLICKHEYRAGTINAYTDYCGYKVIVIKRACVKCGKIKYKKYY